MPQGSAHLQGDVPPTACRRMPRTGPRLDWRAQLGVCRHAGAEAEQNNGETKEPRSGLGLGAQPCWPRIFWTSRKSEGQAADTGALTTRNPQSEPHFGDIPPSVASKVRDISRWSILELPRSMKAGFQPSKKMNPLQCRCRDMPLRRGHHHHQRPAIREPLRPPQHCLPSSSKRPSSSIDEPRRIGERGPKEDLTWGLPTFN